MLRCLRFVIFASFLFTALAVNAQGLRQGLALITSPCAFAPDAPSIPRCLALASAAAAYGVWLSGATVARWRMSVGVHLFAAAALLCSTALGPIPVRVDGYGGGPTDRSLAAMRALADRLVARNIHACATPPHELARMAEALQPPTGYRSFGWAIRFEIVPLIERVEPQREPRPGDGPGTLYLACSRGGRTFWLSAVIADAHTGASSMAVDGVGKPAVVAGEVRP